MDDRLKEIALKAKEQILGAESIQDAEALRIPISTAIHSFSPLAFSRNI